MSCGGVVNWPDIVSHLVCHSMSLAMCERPMQLMGHLDITLLIYYQFTC